VTLEEAQKMVDTALQQRKQFGKMFTVEDMPPEFLDALVMVNGVPSEALQKLQAEYDAEHEKLVLANRQLGAAAARETKLRKQLAEVVKTTGNLPE
jgi:hypothetical protein